MPIHPTTYRNYNTNRHFHDIKNNLFSSLQAVARNKSLQSPTNIFIVNMALSDVLMCLFAVPFTPLHAFLDGWVFGEALCKLFPTSQVIKQCLLFFS